jgi:hypothetical protein
MHEPRKTRDLAGSIDLHPSQSDSDRKVTWITERNRQFEVMPGEMVLLNFLSAFAEHALESRRFHDGLAIVR